MMPTSQAWLARAAADAEARGLPELKPLLERSRARPQALRDADAEFGHPAQPPSRSTTMTTHPDSLREAAGARRAAGVSPVELTARLPRPHRGDERRRCARSSR